MMAYVLVNKKVNTLFPRAAEFWSDHGKKNYNRKYMFLSFHILTLSMGICLPFPLNLEYL